MSNLPETAPSVIGGDSTRPLARIETDTHRTLTDDIELLDLLLGQTIRKLAGEETLALFESVRSAAHDLRVMPSVADARHLRDRLESLAVPALRTLIRAFSIYFDLINLAEQHARVRAIRHRIVKLAPEPMADSAEIGLRQLKESGVTAGKVDALMQQALICPVFTAHPSEARRLTIREKLATISTELDRLNYALLLPGEKENAVARIAEQIEIFWQTSTVRSERPTVINEVRQGLDVVEGSLFHVIPLLYKQLETSLAKVYPDHSWNVRSALRFGSWIGGDRDGNPNVTHSVTAEAVRLHQETVLKHYISLIGQLGRGLSHSISFIQISEEFSASLKSDAELFPEVAMQSRKEPYRGKCRFITAKLQKTLDFLNSLEAHWSEEPLPPSAGVYLDKKALLDDLTVIITDLKKNKADSAIEPVREIMRVVDVFGLHLMTLDIRQHADRHRSAMAEVLKWAGITPNYETLSPNDRFTCLAEELKHNRPLIPAHLPFTPETREIIQTFRTIAAVLEQQSSDAIDTYIISGTGDSAHLLEVLLFAREARLFRPDEGISRLNIVPLFETLDSLRDCTTILQRLIINPVYRQHLKLRGDLQEVMIGYSDSNKESGFVQSAWALYDAQRALANLANRTGLRVQIFHGRGGAVGRGGGPANRAILAQPRIGINGRLRITEQGEMIADRYGNRAIAERHLDQILNAVLLGSLASQETKIDVTWEWVMNRLAERGRQAYRSLVYETPEFLQYFEQATPIHEVSQLKIGSRPARRTKSSNIESLRAIPWVFSWMQSRHTLPGWFGLGTAVQQFLTENPHETDTLKKMYQEWHFWRTLIDNAQMILAKADLTIARLYADLIEDQEIANRIYERIAEEYRRTVSVICTITGQKVLLEKVPILRESIERRNPYVDPMSFIQLVLLKRLRSGEGPQEEILTGVLESINGIASGLKNTG